MKYRRFGNLGFDVSALGFGAMRLPMNGKEIDEAEAIRMIRHSIGSGVNYVDTAYPYHDGASEVIVGKALKNGYREKVKLATKLPCWLIKSPSDFDKYLDIQLKRLDLPSVDFYLLHALSKGSWEQMKAFGVYEWAERAMKDGRFKYLSFSFHDSYDAFEKIVDDYDWAMCQIQYNYMDVNNQAGVKGLKRAVAKGIPVVVMEPLLGGKLVNPPPIIAELWADTGRSAAGWALEWLWSQGEVTTVLSGMSSMSQLEENLALASVSKIGSFSREDNVRCEEARARYEALTAIPCTKCGYCMPCPQGVDIPGNFAAYNEGIMFDKPDGARGQYSWWKFAFEVQHMYEKDLRAVNCVQCRACEDNCPQKIPISEWMPVIHGALGEGKPLQKSL